jgi:L-alanine-DL-glutamate epimerase-like enolase superfamily enzyme
MQITKAEVIPVELSLRRPIHMADLAEVRGIQAIFVRIETRQGQTAWGCTVAHPQLTGEQPAEVLRKCREYARIVPDLHPTNLEYSLTELENMGGASSPGAMCAFDLAFHDLLCLAAEMPLYRILGGYRNRIQTSVTVPISPVDESVETARERASLGFRILKIKGGLDPEQDVRRVKAIRQALPQHRLRLDADGGYTLPQALDVARALQDQLEMLEQPTPAGDLSALRQVTQLSPLPILADQSLSGPASALELAANHAANGLSLKLASCGGLRCARQIDAIARVTRLATMVSCFIEPALLIAAGLSFALSSPNVQYGDLDGNLDLLNDPSRACFRLEEGWLVATDVPGLGYTVDLDA